MSAAVQPIKLAILAMGGEGGGVLADWIVDLAEHNGHLAQSTSVAGVAQRTGATIYYIELFPRALAESAGANPVLALIPTPGDVDVLIASELMEAGRAVQRGLVTQERTTLIASTHRVYAIAEKSAMGDGVADSRALEAACIDAAKAFVRFDMAAVSEATGSVISAVLFGALCGADVLPFTRAMFEATIERGGVGIVASLRAFGEGAALARAPADPLTAPAPAPLRPVPDTHPDPAVHALLQRLRRDFPAPHHPVIGEGLRRLLDYQDAAYAGLYLDRLDALARHGHAALTEDAARHLALWMSYEDTVRVADLKTRATRFERVRAEAKVADAQWCRHRGVPPPAAAGNLRCAARRRGALVAGLRRTAALCRRLHPAGTHGPDQLLARLLAAVCAGGPAPLAPRQPALCGRRTHASRTGCGASTRPRRPTPHWRWRSPAVSAWSRATATPTSAARATSTS